nr:pentatricopeptide repeat-containing protein At5g25630-like isoform X2 [Ipomoea batatas]
MGDSLTQKTSRKNPRETTLIKKQWDQSMFVEDDIQLQPKQDSSLCTFCMSGINCKAVRQKSKLMNILGDSRKPEEALSVFDSLIEGGHKPSLVTYTTLLSILTALKRFNHVHSIISLVKESGRKPDLPFFNAVVYAFSEAGNVKEAMKTVSEMKESGIKPSTTTLNSLIRGYGIAGKPEESLRIMEQMVREDNVKPDERTFGTIICGYCKEGKVKDALKFVYWMKDFGVHPNVIIFNTLIRSLDISDRDSIDEVLTLMEDFGVSPDVTTFSTIMNAWFSAGYMGKCKEVFDDMVKYGIKPGAFAYNILVKVYLQSSEPEKAEGVLADMVKSGIQPNVINFTTVISGWCRAGNMDNARKVFEQMCESGISPTLKTFETLILGYARAKMPWKAQEMVEIMKRFDVQPERSTLLHIENAWHARGGSNEANQMASTIDKDRMNVETLDKVYKKKGARHPGSKLLQIPNVVTNGKKRDVSGSRRNQLMVLREAEVSKSKSPPRVATTSIHLGSRFGKRAPFVCQRQFQGQHFMYCQVGHSCTVFFN